MYKKILVPMALDHGVSPGTLAVARKLLADGGEILALHVHETPQGSVAAFVDEKVFAEALERAHSEIAKKTANMEGVTAEVVEGHSYRTIVDYAEAKGVDCIVIGSHRPDLSDYFLGSTAARVVRHATCAVHVYRNSPDA